METAFSRTSTTDLFDRVIDGLEDEHEIKVLCNLMLTKLIALDPDEAQRRLDPIGERFRRVVSFKPKENAVKQELEKVEEARRGALKVSIALNSAFPSAAATTTAQGQIWAAYWDWAQKEWRAQILTLEQESKAQNQAA